MTGGNLKDHLFDGQNAPRLSLSGQQKAFYETIKAKDPVLANMYLGAVTVLIRSENPERFPQAAHSLRELMEKVATAVDVQVKAQKESLGNKVVQVRDHWKSALQNTSCSKDGNWAGEIDKPLAKFLRELGEFLEWFDEHHPRRKAEIASTLERLDVSGRRPPEPLENLNIERWVKMRDFFIAVAHHGKPTNQDEFSQWVDALEKFVLDLLYPRTFADFDLIDSLVSED